MLIFAYSGKDGSRQVTATVDDAATGKNFVAATVTKNGDLVSPRRFPS